MDIPKSTSPTMREPSEEDEHQDDLSNEHEGNQKLRRMVTHLENLFEDEDNHDDSKFDEFFSKSDESLDDDLGENVSDAKDTPKVPKLNLNKFKSQ